MRTNCTAIEAPPVLQPIVDLLQYRVFCARVRDEVGRVVAGLRAAGVDTKMHLSTVGDSGAQLVAMLTQTDVPQKVSGEAMVRIDNR